MSAKQVCRSCNGLADPQDAPVKPDCVVCADSGFDPLPYCRTCRETVKWPDEGDEECGACLRRAELAVAGRCEDCEVNGWGCDAHPSAVRHA